MGGKLRKWEGSVSCWRGREGRASGELQEREGGRRAGMW